MKKENKVYLAIGIALVVGAGGLWYYTSKKKSDDVVLDVKPEVDKNQPTTKSPEVKSSEPFSKTETAKLKIQPITALVESGVNLNGKKLYANTGDAKVYSVIGTEAGKTKKGQFMGTIDHVEKMTNGTYWIYFVSPKTKNTFKIVSTVVDVEA